LEDAVPRSLDAPLSPREEITLRRVALGMSDARQLSVRELDRLKLLALVAEAHGRLELTPQGRKRYYALPGAAELTKAAGTVGTTLDYFQSSRLH
jgi:hypothetical protein